MSGFFKKNKKKRKEKIYSKNIDENYNDKRKNEIIGILVIAFAALSAISIFTNTAGLVGEKMAELYFYIIGYGSYVIPLILLIWGITLIRFKGLKINIRVVGFLLFYLSSITLLHTYQYYKFPLESALIGQGGGIIAGSISWLCTKLFGYIGSYIVLAAINLIGLLLWFDVFLISIIQHLKSYIKAIRNWLDLFFLKFKRQKKKSSINDNQVEYDNNLFDSLQKEDKERQVVEIDSLDKILSVKSGRNDNNEKMRSTKDNISVSQVTKDRNVEESKRENGEKKIYRLPGLDLLKDTNKNRQKPDNKSNLLEDTLQSFGVNTRVIKVNHGPTITRYEIQPASGVKVSKIVSLADDIALALAAPGVRIEAPIPGKAAVGVEVPHMKNITIGLKDVLSSQEFINTTARIPLGLGMGIDGRPIVIDLTQMPHLLVAGATGSGKSVCINTIIASILYKAKPDEIKLILIDPKKVELSSYIDLPHLFAPVVSDPKKAAGALKLVVEEMENRYELFSNSRSRNIESYNKKLPEEERLPYIVVIIDELSDLMMVAAHDVEDNICRLAQMARAAGIHLVIATQRPSVDVITGLIKANIPSRISFAVSSQIDSRTILDTSGAEKLLGKGDMLLYPTGLQKPQRVQGAFINNEEITALVEFVKKQAKPDFSFDVDDINIVKIEMENDNDNERDELYKEAIKLVVNYRASISMLQRRLHIGHSRAARMIDMMEEDGIVGPYAGSKAREVLISKEDLEGYLNDKNWNGEKENKSMEEIKEKNG